MSDIYELASKTPDVVVVKVKEVDNLTRALHPHMPSVETEYVSITRGDNHIMRFIKKDGSSWSIEWGDRGTTMCSESLNAIKWDIVRFVEEECGVLLGWRDGKVDEATIFYNNNFKRWQLSMREYGDRGRLSYHKAEAMYWSKEAKSFEQMALECTKFLDVKKWVHGYAQTGIEHWTAEVA